MKPMIFSNEQYERLVAAGLVRMGIDAAAAAALLAARWPMFGGGVLSECAGRGLLLTLEDVRDFLREIVGEEWMDGEPIDAAATMFTAGPLESLLRWAIKNGRGKPSFSGSLADEHPKKLDALLLRVNAQRN
jgi:hypothetical protein